MSSASAKKKTVSRAIPEFNGRNAQAQLRDFAQKVVIELSETDPDHSEDLINTLIAELAMSAADQRRRKERRQKQAEGIALAKSKGVRFGRPASPLPDDFDESYQAWRGGEMSLLEAAKSCGMGRSTFYSAALRREQAADQAG